jgi:hypothetical protein
MYKDFFFNFNTLLNVSKVVGGGGGGGCGGGGSPSLGTRFVRVFTFLFPTPLSCHASKNNAVHSQQHILAQLYSATLV